MKQIKKKIAFLLLIYSIVISAFGQKNDTANINRLLSLSEDLRIENPARAMKLAEEANSSSLTLEYKKGIIRSSKQLGNLLLDLGSTEEALQKYSAGLKYAEQAAFDIETMELLNNIGVVYQQKGELNNALKYHLQSLDIARRIDNKKGIAASSNNIGIVQYKCNNPEKALQYFKYSLGIKEELHDTFAIKQTLNNIASVYIESFKYDSALNFYEYCISLEEKMGDKNGLAVTLNNIGQVYLNTGEFEKASQYFVQTLDKLGRTESIDLKASVYDNMGLANYYLKDYNRAIQYFDSCLMLAIKAGNYENEKNAYLHLSETNAALMNYKNAFENFKKYEDIIHWLNEESNDVTVSETIFLKQQKENEILKLEKERETKKLQISILVSLIGFLILIVVLLYIFYRLRQKSILERTLAEQQRMRFKAVIETQEQERKRIAGDLHDSIGQLLSVVKLNMTNLEDSIGQFGQQEKQQFQESIHLVDEACNEVRSISHNLMPAALIRSGIVSALRELVNRINNTNSLTLILTIIDFPDRLTENLEISLYRILQEMVNNIVKHAKASEAEILLTKQGDKLIIRVTDNGIGISKKEIENSSGIGWKNIYSRVSAIDGKINIEKGTKKGSNVVLTIPI